MKTVTVRVDDDTEALLHRKYGQREVEEIVTEIVKREADAHGDEPLLHAMERSFERSYPAYSARDNTYE